MGNFSSHAKHSLSFSSWPSGVFTGLMFRGRFKPLLDECIAMNATVETLSCETIAAALILHTIPPNGAMSYRGMLTRDGSRRKRDRNVGKCPPIGPDMVVS